MNEFLKHYFLEKGDTHMADDYAAFCDWIRDNREFVPAITSDVFANLEMKKEMAKSIVGHLLEGHWDRMATRTMDKRLQSLVKYYLTVALLNDDSLSEDAVQRLVKLYNDEHDHLDVLYGDCPQSRCIIDRSDNAIVTMRGQDDLYDGYRFFVVNMLCFSVPRFVLGMCTDSGPVRSPMKYFKGCRPQGVAETADGKQWNLIACDVSLSDDHLAIFSNQLDGDGTLEICDWLSASNQRLVFRCHY